MASVVLARRGARVVACDLSLGYLREAHQRANANHVSTQLVACNGERLPFADATFDRVWGNAILHHLDLTQATRELHRVLAPGGIAVFCEPWGGNRWLNWARQRLYYPGKRRTADETPFRPCDLATIQDVFPSMSVQGFQLLSMLGRAIKYSRLIGGLAWCDDWLLNQWPHWQQYCRYVVVTIRKEARPSRNTEQTIT
jgi:SAM-dependent methyltransferase